MLKSLLIQFKSLRHASCLPLLVGILAIAATSRTHAARAEVSTPPASCATLQAKYRQLKGKTLVNPINSHTPGYEALDPKDQSKYLGFDIDLGETIGACLGFQVTYKSVAFAALLPTLQSGQADIVISDIYVTEEHAKTADFVTYSKVFDGVLVAQGPEESHGDKHIPLRLDSSGEHWLGGGTARAEPRSRLQGRRTSDARSPALRQQCQMYPGFESVPGQTGNGCRCHLALLGGHRRTTG